MNLLFLPLCLWLLDKPVVKQEPSLFFDVPLFIQHQQEDYLQDRWIIVQEDEKYFSVFWHGPELTNFSSFSNITQLTVETTFKPSMTETDGHWSIKFK